MLRRHTRLVVLLTMVALWPAGTRGSAANDDELATRTSQLIASYATFKGYTEKPDDIYRDLSPDRRAVFDSIVRAMFVPIVDAKGQQTGKRVIDFAQAVTGIWGVRKNMKEGRHMFRLSMRFAPGLASVLAKSSNLGPGDAGHVLLPVQKVKDGDDDPNFTTFAPLLKKDGDVQTFRQAGPHPRLQVSLLTADEQIGEVDIDYDPIRLFETVNPCGCHCRPSNSDVGSRKASSTSDHHLKMLNDTATVFSKPLQTTWSTADKHCKATY